MTYNLSIDYDEGVRDTYRGIVLKGPDNEVRFMTGDPVADWAAYIEHGKKHDLQVIENSSITHFVFDNIEWRFVEGEDGHEYLVAEDRPAYLELIAYAKAGNPEVPEVLEALEDQEVEGEPDIYYLAEAMGFRDGTEFEYLPSEAGLRDWFTTKSVSAWLCSDTPVGTRVVYYEGEPFALQYKPYRKSKPDFTFIQY